MKAKLFWTGRSQAVRLPKEFRFSGDVVRIHREGTKVILQADDDWPDGWFGSWGRVDDDFAAPPRSKLPTRRKWRL